VSLVAFDFPPESTEWTFFVAAIVLLVAPLAAARLRLPGLVGILLGGTLVGPFVLDWIAREGVVVSLGALGLLYLMFLAGLELDLDEFQRNRRPALSFGALTFTIPFALGFLLVLPFGYGLATAALFGSLWASHTLVSYPIVQEHGLTRQRAVGMAAGGTVITDTLALFVLALVVGSVGADGSPSVIFLELLVGVAVLAGYCVLLSRIGSWAFGRLGSDRVPRFLFLLAALTSAALVADEVGLEGIVGAFFAGLALNRLVPSGGELMEGVEFVGAILLIPFFLLSTGMLLDPGQFTEGDVVGIAVASLAVVLVGKAAASYFAGRLSGLDSTEVRLLFGLTVAQAAATLAAVTIGTQVGIFDEDLLSAALIVVLVTVIVGSLVTKTAAERLAPSAARTPPHPPDTAPAGASP
jgi:Kef-type K+ transport system membrane component KefB